MRRILHASQRHGIAFDIDDTLSQTDFHWIERMRIAFPNPERFSRQEIIASYGMFERVPHWQSRTALRFSLAMMNSSDFQMTIPVVKGARRAAQAINRIVPIVAYITARPTSTARGTQRWLTSHGFPAAPVIYRPHHVHYTRKHPWKASLLVSLHPYIRGIIDDSPELFDELSVRNYRGDFFLFDTGRNTKLYRARHGRRHRSWKNLQHAIARRYTTEYS